MNRFRQAVLLAVVFVAGLLLGPLWHQPAGGQQVLAQGVRHLGKYQMAGALQSLYLCDSETGQMWYFVVGGGVIKSRWEPMDSPVYKAKKN